MTDDQPHRPTNVRYVVLGWACSLSMLTYIDRVCIKLVRDDMQDALAIDEMGFRWVFAAFGLAYAIFEVPSGWLGDRFGPRQVLCRIVLWWSFFTALTGCIVKFSHDLGYVLPMPYPLSIWFESVPLVFNSLVLLVIIRFLFGAGEAGSYPNTARALRNWFPYARRGQAQGLLWTFGRWGGAMAPTVVALFVLPYGWRGAFILFGIVGATWVIFFAYFFRNSPADHPGVNAAERAYILEKGDDQAKLPLAWGSMLRSPTLWCLCGMYLFSNAGWCFFITWDEKYYKTVLGLGETELFLGATELLLANSAPLFFGGIACLVGGFVTDRQVRLWGPRWGRTLQGFFSYLFGGCFFLLALAVDVPALAVAFLCAASFCKDFAMAVSWSTCIDVGHRYSGTVAGFMNGVGNLGTFFAPLIVAFLARKGEWSLALVFSAVMFFLACGCWLFINPRKVIVYSDADRDRLKAQGVL
jgi:MFS transporter, ACS family, glucarate transporter